jgi:pimeloyl-ACP methyl ester carboxylesterase
MRIDRQKPLDKYQQATENEAEGARGKVEIRVHEGAEPKTLVYLPGIHGDWTLAGGFRRALDHKLTFVEVSYPLGTAWTHADYAAAIVEALAEKGIHSGWLLGESFGSQIAWEMCRHGAFRIEGIILAGGFMRHPLPFLAKVLYVATGNRSYRVLRSALAVYSQVARFRFGHCPQTLAEIQEFVARRTEGDFRSCRHRLALVARHDPREIVTTLRIPVFALSGLFDPIVPRRLVRRWLELNCAGFREHALIWRADHNVLGTAPKAAAAQVLEWISRQPMTGRF